jgi:light-regulated signal transduction histidine kinase (bacteriophytochrome)
METPATDEIGELSKTFRWMLEERQRAEAENEGLTRQLEKTVEELRSTNKELESFAYSISHDLRAPLRAIDGFSGILAEEHAASLNDQGRHLVGNILRGSGQMTLLLDGLLSFSRLSSRPLSTETVDLEPMVRGIEAELRRQEPDRKIDLVISSLGTLQADPMLIHQVFFNVLANAFKFTRRTEGARVAVSREDKEGQALFAVMDNGAGFEPVQIPKLFGVFQRLHTIEEFEGTGVGLAIVQRIVVRHGGRVWAESRGPGQGVAFYISLPL